MSLNRYGILIEQFIKEEYPVKYKEMTENGSLISKIEEKQKEIMEYRYKLIQEIRSKQCIENIDCENLIEKQMAKKVEETMKKLFET